MKKGDGGGFFALPKAAPTNPKGFGRRRCKVDPHLSSSQVGQWVGLGPWRNWRSEGSAFCLLWGRFPGCVGTLCSWEAGGKEPLFIPERNQHASISSSSQLPSGTSNPSGTVPPCLPAEGREQALHLSVLPRDVQFQVNKKEGVNIYETYQRLTIPGPGVLFSPSKSSMLFKPQITVGWGEMHSPN